MDLRDLKITLKPKHRKKAVCLEAEILNLSGIGAYIFGCSELSLGDELAITLQLSSKEKPMELDAQVVWLPDKQVQPHLYPGIGVAFHNITTKDQEKLLSFIDKNLSRIVLEK